ncbi:maleylpyruvate isomerase family mycothiol-dependent enzyme [Saccharopolyspora sp. NPDC000359]|uniref:maleylpyruvate isomerase family mycothiol-dependent enzyme n=1 Tax=Saccharopolyspora sp. NPDC000359 TaxID=3154251 RepID=UPI0033269E29
MIGNHVAYRRVRENVGELLRSTRAAAELRVPACPEWTVHDLLRHLVEVARVVRGRLTGAVPAELDPGLSRAELLQQWAEFGGEVERVLEQRPGGTGRQLVADAFTHELDLRCALAQPLPTEHCAYVSAFEFGIAGLDRSLREHRLPALLLEADGAKWTAGDGEPAASVRATRVDLYRSLAGRRTVAQIARLSWSAPPEPWLPAFTWGPFTPPTRPVEDMTG